MSTVDSCANIARDPARRVTENSGGGQRSVNSALADVSRRLPHRLLGDDVRDAVVEAILAGKFAPGERLVETNVARDLDVSRGPVREAFRQLAEQGLLVLSAHRGARVSALAGADAYEVYSLMAIAEHLALRLLKRRLTPALVAELRGVVHGMRAAAEQRDVLGVARADLQFNDALFGRVGHGRLRQMWQRLKFQSYLLVRDYATLVYSSLAAMVAHHAKIVDLLETADWDKLFTYLHDNDRRIEAQFLEFSEAAPNAPPPVTR